MPCVPIGQSMDADVHNREYTQLRGLATAWGCIPAIVRDSLYGAASNPTGGILVVSGGRRSRTDIPPRKVAVYKTASRTGDAPSEVKDALGFLGDAARNYFSQSKFI